MFKTIPGFSRYEINVEGVIRNKRTGEVRKPNDAGALTLLGDDKIIYNRTINSLMKLAGFKQIWIDPEATSGN